MNAICRVISVASILALLCSCGGDRGEKPAGGESDEQLTARQKRQIEALEALAYVQGDRPARAETNVTRHDRSRAWPGINLYTSEHAPGAYLIDMEGEILHEWKIAEEGEEGSRPIIRRAKLYENGDLLALLENAALIRLDRESRVLWELRENVHHDFDVAADGTIYTLGRKASVFPEFDPEEPILNDYIVIVDPGGTVRKRISLLDALKRSTCCDRYLPAGRAGDAFHSNTIEILDGRFETRHGAFRAGNLLTSWRTPNAIGIIDVEAEEVVWALEGPFRKQHQPTLLENGNMLIFDNVDATRGERASRVIEIDPFSGDVVWEFFHTEEFPFFTRTGGSNQPLPNGNVLITETREGRAFEVTPERDVVWIFTNPARVGTEDLAMARLFNMQRLPLDFPTEWSTGERPPID